MSSCCTPEYIKLSFLSPTGDIKIQRVTGAEPSCGYYYNYTGAPELDNYDYYEVDIQYNSGSGFWTFSGNSTGFNDPTIYRSIKTGTPCDPIGEYTGGIYLVQVELDKKWPIYEFANTYNIDKNNVFGLGVGSGVRTTKDARFNVSFVDRNGKALPTAVDMARSSTFAGASYDIIDIDGSTVYENYFSGYKSFLKITEEENIKIFGSYKKDFGIRVTSFDVLIGKGGSSEFYSYGNNLYIDSIFVSDQNGTTEWLAEPNSSSGTARDYGGSGFVPSGFTFETVDFKTVFANNTQYTNPSTIDFYYSDTPDVEIIPSRKIRTINLRKTSSNKKIKIDDSWGLAANKDYWFGVVASSEIGSGNLLKIGPHKISKQGPAPRIESFQGLKINDGSSDFQQIYKTGSIAENVTGNSGILDTIVIDTGRLGQSYQIFKDNKYKFTTVKTNTGGFWEQTNFDYKLQFKDLSNPYTNVSKHVRLTATGSSIDPLNSGMPLFELKDYDTGQAVELDIHYLPSGFYLVSNTGHQYDTFKYHKDLF